MLNYLFVTLKVADNTRKVKCRLAFGIRQLAIYIVYEQGMNYLIIFYFYRIVQGTIPSYWLLIVYASYFLVIIIVEIYGFCDTLVIPEACLVYKILVSFKLCGPPTIPNALIRQNQIICFVKSWLQRRLELCSTLNDSRLNGGRHLVISASNSVQILMQHGKGFHIRGQLFYLAINFNILSDPVILAEELRLKFSQCEISLLELFLLLQLLRRLPLF